MSFSEAVATQPDWVRLWVLWLTVAMAATPLALLIDRRSRRMGWIVLGANLAALLLMQGLFAAVGFTRLLGAAHLVTWGPLLAWGLVRLRRGEPPGWPRAVLIVFLASIAVSLAFDAVDVARWILGERGSLVPAAAAAA